MSEHTDFDDRSHWRPTYASTALVVLVSLLTAAVLVRSIGVSLPVVLGALGAAALALAVWTAGWERHRALGTALTSLLSLLVGIGLLAATGGTILVLVGVLFPVPTVEQLPDAVIDVAARAMVVVGAVSAVFGGLVAIGNVLNRETAQRAASISLKTTLFPLGAGLVLLTGEMLSHLESTNDAPGVGAAVGDVLRQMTAIFFQPPPVRPNLATFFLLIAVALFVCNRTLATLPVAELTTEATGTRAIERIHRLLTRATIVAGISAAIGLFTDFTLSARALRALLTPPVFDQLTALTTAPSIRSLAWWTILVGTATILVVGLLRHLVQSSADRIGSALAPYVVGGAIAVVTTAIAKPVLTRGIEWVASTLPGSIGDQFREIAALVVDSLGSLALVMAAVGVLLLLATGATVGLWLLMLTKYLDGRTAGIGIASGSLFQTAAFAGVVGVSLPVLFGSLIAAVLVWDAGEFGTTLGQEVGRDAATRRAELVHASGSLAVGGVGAGAALAITDGSVGLITVADGTVVVGLVVVLAGLLALVVALR
ncbi:hypothetical protein BRC91_07940 [Halobacteriales archaeon QS_4_62_28]|nr:MAG: hypothetical protein BRC91_07940 [Halobacteriales archaeon QS_4_62_28]